jgi:DNA repair protein RadD
MRQFRDYQHDLDLQIDAAFENYSKLLLCMATGGGKTVVFSNTIRKNTGASAAVAHRREIISQISMSLAHSGVRHRIIAPPNVIGMVQRKHLKELGRSFISAKADTGVVSVQTLTSKASGRNARLQAWIKRCTLAVLDECHHYVQDGLWGRTIELFRHSRVLGVTATSERADGKGLGTHANGFAEKMIVGPSPHELIEEGWLAPFSYHAPKTDLNMSDIPITASGDISIEKMRVRIEKSKLVGDVVSHYKRFALGKRAIVFANDVKTADIHAEEFIKAGIPAVALSGHSEDTFREESIEGFANGTGAKVLINVGLFDEGFDVPAVEAVILARVTFSVAKYLQMVGRVLRPVFPEGFPLETAEQRKHAIASSEKPKAIVIDAVANWERNGLPTWPRAWTLDNREKAASKKDQNEMVAQSICTNEMCLQPYPSYYKACPYCGSVKEYTDTASIEAVEGDLEELDVKALEALFAKLKTARMSNSDYQAYQIKRNIPVIGRAADLRRFKASKHPRRTKSEYQRRFYARFGIDMITARTLKAKETDALMDRMMRHFHEDIIDI